MPTSSATTQRSNYFLAGQLIAVRVVTGSNSTLYFTLADHLGNVSAIISSGGMVVSGSLARYEPFGGFRTEPTSNPAITDRGFTGHKHNNTGTYDIGLVYMNARYYLPEIGRFISADTIVPDPQNPQSFNRYSYGYNNPVKYLDPTGHRSCSARQALNDFETCDQNIEIPPANEIQYDLTSWLGSEMLINLYGEELSLVLALMEMARNPDLAAHTALSGGSAFLAAQGAWFEMTRDYGVWDLKREMRSQIGEAIVLCGEACAWFDYSVPGNIHYGFLAAAAGIPREESYWAGGLLELAGGEPGDFSTGFENPADKAAVDLGYDLFETHGYDFVPNNLRAALTPDVMSALQQPPTMPTILARPQANRYSIGAFNYGQ